MFSGFIEPTFEASCEICHIGMSPTESKHRHLSKLTYCAVVVSRWVGFVPRHSLLYRV